LVLTSSPDGSGILFVFLQKQKDIANSRK